MHLEAPNKIVEKSPQEVFEFLTNVENYRQLMPENIAKFELLGPETFLFGLKGMPEISLALQDKTPHEKVVLGAAGGKLPFTLTANITELEPNKSEVSLAFDGEFNAMMAMMVKGPITNFLGTLSQNMSKI